MLLELAFACEHRSLGDAPGTKLPLWRTVFHAAYRIEADRGDGGVLFGPGAEQVRRTVVSAEDVAERISETPVAGITAALLRDALVRAVDTARYWQEPDGTDLLCEHPAMRQALARLAEQVASSAAAQWWAEAVDPRDQWAHDWEEDPRPPNATPRATLEAWAAQTVADEERAARDRPADPTAAWGGHWWSTPAPALLRSTRRFPGDGAPAGLYLVEDGLGWERAGVRRLEAPDEARIVEIASAEDWAELCLRYPLEVSAEKRHDWYRVSGRAGRWTIPDWSRVARDYDAAHLTVAGYLAAACTAIELGSGRAATAASMIAGWNPDETYWFTDRVRLVDAAQRWRLEGADGPRPRWERVDGS